MNETHKRADDLVADYLARVRQAAARLSPARREELVEDLREHIAAARAELNQETEAEVRALLDRVGDPAGIVAEALVGEPPPPPPTISPVQPPPEKRNGVLVTVLVILAVALGLPVLACIVGIALMRVNGHHEPAVPPAPVEVSHMPQPSSPS